MPIYEKPVRLLFKDFVSKQNIIAGQIILKDQVVSAVLRQIIQE